MIDLSTDVACHAEGPFETTMKVLEPEPGAVFFCEKVLRRLVPHAVGRLEPRHFPQSAFLRHELVTASVHAGSHIDAPGHYGPNRSGGSGWINDAPLELFVGRGVVISAPDDREMVAAVQATAASHEDMRGVIALLRVGQERPIPPVAVHALLDRGVRVIGTDAASFDGPFGPMIDRFLATRDSSQLWPTHIMGRERPYYQIERLCNLSELPSDGFVVVAAPVKIEGATAAWTRAFALVPRRESNPVE